MFLMRNGQLHIIRSNLDRRNRMINYKLPVVWLNKIISRAHKVEFKFSGSSVYIQVNSLPFRVLGVFSGDEIKLYTKQRRKSRLQPTRIGKCCISSSILQSSMALLGLKPKVLSTYIFCQYNATFCLSSSLFLAVAPFLVEDVYPHSFAIFGRLILAVCFGLQGSLLLMPLFASYSLLTRCQF